MITYTSKTLGNKVLLIKILSNMKYMDDTSIYDHLNEFQNVLIQLKQLKISFDAKVCTDPPTKVAHEGPI